MASTYASLNVHVIFATKDRKPRIDEAWRRDLHNYMAGAVSGLGTKTFAIGGVTDHVHLLVGLRTTQATADLVREVKKSSSVWAGQRCRDFSWQEGYAAFSVGHSDIRSVVAYIANQERHHHRESSAEEMRRLLAEFEIEYDQRFFE